MDYFGIHQGSCTESIGWTQASVTRKEPPVKYINNQKEPIEQTSVHAVMTITQEILKPIRTTERSLNSVSQKDFFHSEEGEIGARDRAGATARARVNRKFHFAFVRFTNIFRVFRAQKYLNFS